MATDKIIKFDQEEHAENTISTDYRAEVLAVGLIEQGYDVDRTLIIRNGSNRRGISKDIEEVSIEYSMQNLIDYLYIKINRDSLYDSLPEGLFHSVEQSKKRQSKEDIIKQIQNHRSEEFYARRFFRPFEIVLDQTSVYIQQYERMFEQKNVNRKFVDTFLQYWPIIKILPLRQAVLFMKFIPVIQDINNDFNKISETMSAILGYNVKVQQGNTEMTENKKDDEVSPLGECVLNKNLVIGKLFNDGYYNIKMLIGPIRAKSMEYFAPNENGYKILNFLIDMIIPCDRNVYVEYVINDEDAKFTVTDNNSEMPYLGVNTFL